MPASSTAWISTDGIPHSPNPPTASVAPSGMSATAASALATTLSMDQTIAHKVYISQHEVTERRRRPETGTATVRGAI